MIAQRIFTAWRKLTWSFRLRALNEASREVFRRVTGIGKGDRVDIICEWEKVERDVLEILFASVTLRSIEKMFKI